MGQVLLTCNDKSLSSPLLGQALAFLEERFSLLSITGRKLQMLPSGGAEAWVVIGGDGTLNRVVNLLMAVPREERPPLCYIPFGTGNDFARTLALPGDTSLLRQAFAGGSARRVSLSVGRCNDRFFVNMASGGIFATVTPETNAQLKSLAGSWSYLITGVGKLMDRQTLVIECNGEKRGPVLGFFVANARYAGGGVQIAPKADPSDPLLDYLLVPEMPTTDLVALALELQKQEPDLSGFKVTTGASQRLQLEFENPVPINLDGEQVLLTSAAFTILENALEIFVPPAADNGGV